jgi:DedD protein
MQRGLGGTVFEPTQEPQEGRDKELTVGPAMLVGFACCLLALCGLCFVFGYKMGHRRSESASAVALPAPGTPVAAPSASPQSSLTPQSKPSAGQSGAQPPSATTDQPGTPDADSAAGGTPGAPVSSVPDTAAVGTNPSERSVGTALTGRTDAPQPVPRGATVAPALGQSSGIQSSGIMVQIAAVSRSEDADVLVGALRKRGYTVAYRHDPTDGLLHVQIGPFANRNDAFAMRQKLLNDGYNAIVLP